VPSAQIVWQLVRQLPPPLLAASAGGWMLLALQEAGHLPPALCVSAVSAGGDMTTRLLATFAVTTPLAILPVSLAMLIAMMPPLLAPPLLHVWRRSLTRRRTRAVLLFVLGYLAVWLAALLPLVAASIALDSISITAGWPAATLAATIALVWQATPLKQISLNGCHRRPPLAAFGLRAEADALCYGAGHGLWCVGTCWALMLLPLAASGPLHWVVMLAVMLISAVERVRTPQAGRWGSAWPRLRLPLRISPKPMARAA
jgi:predicted metal-binding membrane protein